MTSNRWLRWSRNSGIDPDWSLPCAAHSCCSQGLYEHLKFKQETYPEIIVLRWIAALYVSALQPSIPFEAAF